MLRPQIHQHIGPWGLLISFACGNSARSARDLQGTVLALAQPINVCRDAHVAPWRGDRDSHGLHGQCRGVLLKVSRSPVVDAMRRIKLLLQDH